MADRKRTDMKRTDVTRQDPQRGEQPSSGGPGLVPGQETRWTATMQKATELVWAGRLRDGQIARDLGIGRRTLTRWKTLPAFRARIEEYSRALQAAHNREMDAEIDRSRRERAREEALRDQMRDQKRLARSARG